VPILARKPGALRNGAPFKDWVLPSAIKKIRRKLTGSADGDRQMVKILAAVLEDVLPAVDAPAPRPGIRASIPPTPRENDQAVVLVEDIINYKPWRDERVRMQKS